MAQSGSLGRFIIPVICIVVTVLGLNNVYGSSAEVERRAEEIACGETGCAVKKLSVNRSPLAQTYVFQTSLRGGATSQVECAREYVLVGDYQCERK